MKTRPRRPAARVPVCLLVLACATGANAAYDQPPDVTYPALPARAADAAGFVPAGWVLEHSARGDLDTDRRDDLLLVLRMRSDANIVDNDGFGEAKFDTNPRILAIALADAQGYRLALQDHALIPRPDVPTADDYLDGDDAVSIVRGTVRIRLHWWLSAGGWGTWNNTFTFRREKDCFRLIGYDRDDLQRNSGQTTDTSINYLTRRVRIDEGSIENDAVKTRWRRLTAQPPLCLAQVGNGFEFDPGLPEDAPTEGGG